MLQPGSLSTRKAILLGGLTVGVLDIADAFTFFYLRSGGKPLKILQSIASGLLGRPAFDGGWATGAVGLGIHFCIATTIVAFYVLVSRRLKFLTRWTIPCGLVYGAGAWVFMNFVVLPFTKAGHGPILLPVAVNGILIHMLGVGLPSAIAARMQAPRPTA
jgi:hypothetical protein